MYRSQESLYLEISMVDVLSCNKRVGRWLHVGFDRPRIHDNIGLCGRHDAGVKYGDCHSLTDESLCCQSITWSVSHLSQFPTSFV